MKNPCDGCICLVKCLQKYEKRYPNQEPWHVIIPLWTKCDLLKAYIFENDKLNCTGNKTNERISLEFFSKHKNVFFDTGRYEEYAIEDEKNGN